MHNPNDLSEEDMNRVNSVINSGYNDVDRGSFKFWKLFTILWIIVGITGLIAYIFGQYFGSH